MVISGISAEWPVFQYNAIQISSGKKLDTGYSFIVPIGDLFINKEIDFLLFILVFKQFSYCFVLAGVFFLFKEKRTFRIVDVVADTFNLNRSDIKITIRITIRLTETSAVFTGKGIPGNSILHPPVNRTNTQRDNNTVLLSLKRPLNISRFDFTQILPDRQNADLVEVIFNFLVRFKLAQCIADSFAAGQRLPVEIVLITVF